MTEDEMLAGLRSVSTSNLADGVVRAGEALRVVGGQLAPVLPAMRCAGRAVPVRHFGSVSIFLEALAAGRPGDVLVVDNGGRLDEGCIGDLITLEVKQAGFSGILIWGAHRDTADAERIGLPLFSLGRYPAQPQREDVPAPDALEWARVGPVLVRPGDYVSADSDGVVFFGREKAEAVVAASVTIRTTEGKQAEMMLAGRSLRGQLDFDRFAATRKSDPRYGLRAHMKTVAKRVEV